MRGKGRSGRQLRWLGLCFNLFILAAFVLGATGGAEAGLSVVGRVTGTAQDVVVVGSYAYVASGSAGLRVIDVTNRANPVKVGSVSVAGGALKVCVSRGYALVTNTQGVRVVDVRNPKAPKVVWSQNMGCSGASSAFISGSYAYVTNMCSGMTIVDVSNPVSPRILGSVPTKRGCRDVFVSGKYAYVADDSRGLYVINVSNPNNPVVEYPGRSGSVWYLENVFVSGKYAYVNGYDGMMQDIVDVGNPQHPAVVGHFDLPMFFGTFDTFVYRNHAFLAADDLRVVDVSDPANPVTLDTMPISGGKNVFVSGAYAYLADGGAGLKIVDASDYLIKSKGIVAGSVKAGGSPLAQKAVSLYRRSGSTLSLVATKKTDEQGRYKFTNLKKGIYSIKIRNIAIQGSITGGVTLEGWPLASAPVELLKKSGTKWVPVTTKTTGATGRYGFTQLANGTYGVNVPDLDVYGVP